MKNGVRCFPPLPKPLPSWKGRLAGLFISQPPSGNHLQCQERLKHWLRMETCPSVGKVFNTIKVLGNPCSVLGTKTTALSHSLDFDYFLSHNRAPSNSQTLTYIWATRQLCLRSPKYKGKNALVFQCFVLKIWQSNQKTESLKSASSVFMSCQCNFRAL